MSTDTPTSNSQPTGEIDADTRAELIELGERLTAVDGPLVGSGDRESVEEIVYRLLEAIGGRRAAEISDEPIIEAVGSDTYWRKYTHVPTFRAEAGPFLVQEACVTDNDAEEAFLEVAPNGAKEGLVCVDGNLKARAHGVNHEQGALHMMTPNQARSFAAALAEQAEYVEQQTRAEGEKK